MCGGGGLAQGQRDQGGDKLILISCEGGLGIAQAPPLFSAGCFAFEGTSTQGSHKPFPFSPHTE